MFKTDTSEFPTGKVLGGHFRKRTLRKIPQGKFVKVDRPEK
jgi:hypothetical protein